MTGTAGCGLDLKLALDIAQTKCPMIDLLCDFATAEADSGQKGASRVCVSKTGGGRQTAGRRAGGAVEAMKQGKRRQADQAEAEAVVDDVRRGR